MDQLTSNMFLLNTILAVDILTKPLKSVQQNCYFTNGQMCFNDSINRTNKQKNIGFIYYFVYDVDIYHVSCIMISTE